MKRYWSLAIVALLIGCAAKPEKKSPIVRPIREPRSIEKLQAAPLYTFNEREIDAYLKHLYATEPDAMARIQHLARKQVGQPYAIYLLGEYPYEIYDPDPMYCLDKSDCVTFVEHMYAMGLSKDWQDFFTLLQRLRYKEGKVGMTTRNHESCADWNPNNAWMFEDVTAKLGGGKQSKPLNMTWKPSKFFAQFGIGQEMKDVKVESAYIPRGNVANVTSDIRTGDIIQIVRGNEKEQYVGHFGMASIEADGTANMIHSAEPRVRVQGILNYVERNPKTLGIKVLRPRADLQKLADTHRNQVTLGG